MPPIILLMFAILAHLYLANAVDFYTASVVDFAAVSDPMPDNLKINVKEYLKLIRQAKLEGSDIIVFPENGLIGYNSPLSSMTSVVPDPKYGLSPCEMHTYTSTMIDISCAAKENSIYVVVNIAEAFPCGSDHRTCPERGWLQHNTNVVFDRDGRVVSRYRKYHLFGEPGTWITEKPEESIFDSDFGVRFATFTCFDILFEQPALSLVRDAGVTDVLFTSAWFAVLPFYTALQTQSGWSYAEDINLLAAGYNDPEHGSTGSGIHLGRLGTVNYTTGDEHVSKMITSIVPKKAPRQRSVVREFNFPEKLQLNSPLSSPLLGSQDDDTELDIISVDGKLLTRSFDLSLVTSELLDQFHHSSTLCHGDLCCSFKVTYQPLSQSPYRYRAVVFRGVLSFLGFATGGSQFCAIVACTDSNPNSCGARFTPDHEFFEILIKGSFEFKRATVMPSIADSDFIPTATDSFKFSKSCSGNGCQVAMSLVKPVSNLLTFGINGRIFTLDGDVAELY